MCIFSFYKRPCLDPIWNVLEQQLLGAGKAVYAHVVSGTTTRRQIQPGSRLQEKKNLVCKRGGYGAQSSRDAQPLVSAFGIPQTRFVQLQKGLYSSV